MNFHSYIKVIPEKNYRFFFRNVHLLLWQFQETLLKEGRKVKGSGHLKSNKCFCVTFSSFKINFYLQKIKVNNEWRTLNLIHLQLQLKFIYTSGFIFCVYLLTIFLLMFTGRLCPEWAHFQDNPKFEERQKTSSVKLTVP